MPKLTEWGSEKLSKSKYPKVYEAVKAKLMELGVEEVENMKPNDAHKLNSEWQRFDSNSWARCFKKIKEDMSK